MHFPFRSLGPTAEASFFLGGLFLDQAEPNLLVSRDDLHTPNVGDGNLAAPYCLPHRPNGHAIGVGKFEWPKAAALGRPDGRLILIHLLLHDGTQTQMR
jgi:hypothetical protein